MDKLLLHHPGIVGTPSDVDEVLNWESSTRVKGGTEIALLCQKGQKSAADPTPNQDNFFIHHIGPISMYGVADGHGPFGHLVSFRLVQTLPHFLTTSKHWGKDWAECLKEGFLAAQADLETFCGQQNINIE